MQELQRKLEETLVVKEREIAVSIIFFSECGVLLT